MQAMKISAKEATTLYNAQCELYHIAKSLAGVLDPSVIQRLNSVHNNIISIIQPSIDAQDKLEEASQEFFGKVQEENNFFSIWSMYEILPQELYSKHSFKKTKSIKKINSISYQGIKIEFNSSNKPKTWFDLWKLADQLMRQSGDTHHCFLEGFNVVNGEIQVSTGS